MIAVLAGGVGAARFLQGLTKIVSPRDVTVIVNTGDDIDWYGLRISPDLDIITYTLAGIVDERRGWGLKDDTTHCLQGLGAYGWETWFRVGDRDLATHLYRTHRLRQGADLDKVTAEICKALNIRVRIIPMSNNFIQTSITTPNGAVNFQEYLVKRRMHDPVRGVQFKGIGRAKPAPGVVDSILRSERIVICPSNPIVSIGPIISLKGVKEALVDTDAKVVGVSPIIQGAPVKGPADRLLKGLNLEVSSFSVAKLYRSFLDVFVIDSKDEAEKPRIEGLGVKVVATKTLMETLEDKTRLAQVVLDV